jgi:hypothetical protein
VSTPVAEQEHLKLEREKIRQGWWGIVATVASILIAAGAIWLQLRVQAEMRGLDLFLNSPETACTVQGEILLTRVGSGDDPETEREWEKEWKQICDLARVNPPTTAVQRDLAGLLAQYPSQRSEILAMYRVIISPEAEWIDRIEAASS